MGNLGVLELYLLRVGSHFPKAQVCLGGSIKEKLLTEVHMINGSAAACPSSFHGIHLYDTRQKSFYGFLRITRLKLLEAWRVFAHLSVASDLLLSSVPGKMKPDSL